MTTDRYRYDSVGDSRHLEELFAQYVDRLQRGENLHPQEILAKHPDVGEKLIECLEDYIGTEDRSFDGVEPLGTLGDYTLRRQIGRGGMGVVYEAWENSMERAVALKVLPAAVAADEKAVARFQREARLAGKLNHEHIVRVFSTGVREGTPWYSMEYVEGETLAQTIANIKDTEPGTETLFGPKDQEDYFMRLGRGFADVADGLQHAHSMHVIHRDIKPSNLILDGDGRLRILDFGLARLEGQDSLTISGDVLGTPLYMSPEQARRKKIPIDHRTDIYSLGATMYEAVCGRPPLRGKDHAETLSQIIDRDPVEPRKINACVPKDLATIVLKCLRKDADDRYGTAEALGQDLRRFVRGDPVEARPASGWDRALNRLRRHRVLALVTLIIVSLGISCGYLAYTLAVRNDQQRAADYEDLVVSSAFEVLRARIVLGRESAGGLGRWVFRNDAAVRTAVRSTVKRLTEAAAILPDRFEAHYYQARALKLLNRREDALAAAERALRRQPDFVPAILLRARLADSERRDFSRSTIDIKTGSQWGSIWREAKSAELRNYWKKAVVEYSELTSLDEATEGGLYLGSTIDLFLSRGMARLRAEAPEQAIEDFAGARALCRKTQGYSLEPDLLMVKAYHQAGRRDHAHRVCEESYAQTPAAAAFWIAALYLSLRAPEEGLAWTNRMPPGARRAKLQMELYAIQDSFDEAVDAGRTAVQYDPDDSEVHIGLARMLWLRWVRHARTASQDPNKDPRDLIEARDLLEKAKTNPGFLAQINSILDRRDYADKTRQPKEGGAMNASSKSIVTAVTMTALTTLGAQTLGHDGPTVSGVWTNSEPLAINSAGINQNAVLSPNGLELYFTRGGGINGGDIFVARRDDPGAAWDPLRVEAAHGLNTHLGDNPNCISPDGRRLYIHSTRSGPSSLYVATRAAEGAPWDEIDLVKGNINDPVYDTFHSAMTRDESMAAFASNRPGGGGGDWDLWLAEWKDNEWQVVRALDELNTPATELGAAISEDGLTIFYASWVRSGNSKVYCASRASREDRFGPGVLLGPEVNGKAWNGSPNLSWGWPGDGATLFWSRCFAGNHCDLWSVTWQAVQPPRFVRGDANTDGVNDIADPVYALNHLFGGGPAPSCMQTADTNDDNTVDVSDPVYQLNHLFGGGPTVSAPAGECGVDPSPAANAEDDLSCNAYPLCEA